MMLQLPAMFGPIGVILLLFGVFLIMSGFCMAMAEHASTTEDSQHVEKQSRGIVLIGPIPIVWGFGKWSRYVTVLALLIVIVGLLLLLS